jgi:hypothetical protein
VDNDAGAIYFGNGVTNGIFVSSAYWNVNFDRPIYSFNGTEGCCVRTRYAQLGLKMGNQTPSIDFAISDVDTGLNSEGTDELGIYTGGTERIRINSSGNVGIGTTDPSALLTLDDSSGYPYIHLNKSGTQKVSIGYNNGSDSLWLQGSSHITFHSGGGTERMRINSSGNVGIGTSNPSTKLLVYDGEIYLEFQDQVMLLF